MRSLHRAFGAAVYPVTYDPFSGRWRPLEPWESANLNASRPGATRGARWPLGARLRGRLRRLVRSPHASQLPSDAEAVVFPEVFSPAVAAALPPLFAAVRGPRVAIFHDAIALKLPELSPAKTVARFPAYLRELLVFDAIAAVSDDSRDALLDYWRWLGVSILPPVKAIPLGVTLGSGNPLGYRSPTAPDTESRGAARTARMPAAGSGNPLGYPPVREDAPVVLCVGSVEGRKNHRPLLDACERLWAGGTNFRLHLIGHAQRETGAIALDRIRELQAAGRPLRYDGAVDEEALEAAYAACAFTVYPSLLEGFGLPVLESVGHGKPCICFGNGALGEAARGGGCVALGQVDAGSLAVAIGRLIGDGEERARLTAAARARKLRRWSDYAADLGGWIRTLPRNRDVPAAPR